VGQCQSDGFVAVGNFDSDEFGEIVVAREGTLRLQDDDGTVLWTKHGLTGSTIGPPTIADFDNDGQPEIGVAGSGVYMVVEANGNTKWSRSTVDYSSGFTGSAVFDFEGDGAAEVVYADENDVWVFDGATGTVKMQESRHSSATCSEYPAIADVDNDGHAEIIYASGAYSGSESGVTVIGDESNSWQAARPVWNQHAYAITNVEVDASIPVTPATNWLDFNTFRSGDILAGQGGSFPDLYVEIEHVCEELCEEDTAIIWYRVGNKGVVDVEVPVIIYIWAVTPTGDNLVDFQTVHPPINAGRLSASTEITLDVSGLDVRALKATIDPAGMAAECDEDNNDGAWLRGVCN